MSNNLKGIKLGRYKLIPYTVRYVDEGGMMKQYEWAGMKGEKVDVKSVPEELVNFLEMNSFCFRQGELKIIEDTKIAKEIVENLSDKEEYKKNALTRDEMLELLNGNYKKLESEVKSMNKETVNCLIDLAKEIKMDSSAKQRILSEAIGMDKNIDLVFNKE
ncbi:hypothetical protein K144316041_p20250 (plasmid) [Clostridium tetani]|uniref:hypothetical protein n=1 Tax=Clostridium tetani TaxID=1513 RepID=UPI002954DA9F|nr:hypothetical protein [Clostridium tetani]BDR74186.1 hypothetical protein K144316041_p20250 [Clostridium tetani]